MESDDPGDLPAAGDFRTKNVEFGNSGDITQVTRVDCSDFLYLANFNISLNFVVMTIFA